MKKIVLSLALVAGCSLLVPSINSKSKTTKYVASSQDIDERVVLLAGEDARASDGTYIPASNRIRVVTICPGWGWFCRGSATIGGMTYNYNSGKGIGKPDIIIVES